MKFFTDGSRVGTVEQFYIGWSAVCIQGVIVKNAQIGGSNINAEMFAIRDILKYLSLPQVRILGDDKYIEIVTDSLTSIQIITGYLKAPEEFDINESINYDSAMKISNYIGILKERGIEVSFKHVRGHGKDSSMEVEDIWGNLLADTVATDASNDLRYKNS